MAEELQKYLMENIVEIRELVTENNAEIRELKGEFRIFKEAVTDRFKRNEEYAGQQKRDRFTVIGILISAGLLSVNIIVNFFK
jgi:hypothetical protein